MKLILLGAPGSGKGTQAAVLSTALDIPSISTGNILREAIRNGTPTGQKAKAYTEKGALVPDEIILGIIQERLAQDDCKNGFILDGFPRTIPQAEALERMGVAIDAAVSLEVADEKIERRMTGRRTCPGCGASYHLEYHPPVKDGVCDSCGQALVQRADDAPETVRARLKVYHETTEPIKGFYEARGLLRLVPAEDEIDAITKRVLTALEAGK